MVWQGQQCQALQTEEEEEEEEEEVNRTFAGQDDEQLCLHAHKVCIPAHNDWVLGVNGGAAAVKAAAFVTLVVDATEVKLTFQPTDSAPFGAVCPSDLAFASDSAEVMPFWPFSGQAFSGSHNTNTLLAKSKAPLSLSGTLMGFGASTKQMKPFWLSLWPMSVFA